MFVLTIDQDASRRHPDGVPALLTAVAACLERAAVQPVLAFERTVGDEVQGLLDSAAGTLAVARTALRLGSWQIGIGVGQVSTPLPVSTREASGEAFLHARSAVERARKRGVGMPVAVVGEREASADAEAVLRLVGAIIQRRSRQGWEVIDALEHASGTYPMTQQDVAVALGISAQAVSQRLRNASWHDERDALPVLERLLKEADR